MKVVPSLHVVAMLAHVDKVVVNGVHVEFRSLCFSGVSVEHLVDVLPYLSRVETVVHKP